MIVNAIITIASVITALGVIIGVILKIHNWYLKQDNQDKSHEKDIQTLEKKHKEDITQLREENCLICFALSACLDGLMQLGANHTVPVAKEKLDKYLNQQAHK